MTLNRSWSRSCGTAGKPGGNGEDKVRPKAERYIPTRPEAGRLGCCARGRGVGELNTGSTLVAPIGAASGRRPVGRSTLMDKRPSISKTLLITTFGGAAFAAIVVVGVLVPLKVKGLLPPHYGWPKVLAGPLICFFLLSGVVVTSLISDRLGLEPWSAKSVLVDFIYVGILVLAIAAIAAFP
jgi:hypothetical protein